ncbi:hypothetical protein MKX03_036057 [Papaver bracteatum]|nr:hypothetical protein MKX03_036057 [Papaver bracteatum]
MCSWLRDKFEVASCMRYCSRLLRNMPMTPDSAFLYLELPSGVASEDAVYDFVLKWAKMHYPKIEDRREVLGSRLGRLIRFPYITCRKLKKVLTCNDFDHDLTSKVVLEALFFKVEAPHRQRTLTAEEFAVTNRRFFELKQNRPTGPQLKKMGRNYMLALTNPNTVTNFLFFWLITITNLSSYPEKKKQKTSLS